MSYETVYFRRSAAEPEDSITVLAGTAKQHVREGLITRIESFDPEKHPHFVTWTWDVPVGRGRWKAEYGWTKPLGASVYNVRPLFSHPCGVMASGEAQQADYERVHSLAHAWAQECYFKGLGRPARVDETRGAFQKALRALIAHGVTEVPRG